MKKTQKNAKGYFDFDDIEIDMSAFEKVSIDDMIYYNDLKNRRLYLDMDVEDVADDIVRNIMRYNADDREKGLSPEERKPIVLYVTSNGGNVESGYAIIDAIKLSKTPVYTVNAGYAYSMAFLIMLAGTKRFSLPNAKFLMHDGTTFTYNSSGKAQDKLKFDARVEERIREYVVSHTKITEEMYDENSRCEWYMFADEAKDFGVIDAIVGEDCSLDDIM